MDLVMFRLTKHHSDLLVLSAPTLGSSPWKHDPSSGMGARFLGAVSSAASTPGCNSTAWLCFRAFKET